MAPSLFLLSQPTWTPLIMGKAKRAMPKKSQTPTLTGRNDSQDLLSLLAYADKLEETQQHLEEVSSLMQHTVPLEGLINAQDNRTLQAAKSCLKRLHVRVEALANVMERTVTTQQIQFMHEMAQTHCRKSNGTDQIKGGARQHFQSEYMPKYCSCS